MMRFELPPETTCERCGHRAAVTVCTYCKLPKHPFRKVDLQRIPCSHCAGYGCSRCNLAGESYVMVTR